MKTYRAAPMDGITLGVTISVWTLFLMVMMVLIGHHDVVSLAESGFLILIVLFTWQVKGYSYEIRENAIVINRGWPFGSTVIPLADVRDVRRFKFTLLTIRSFGIGGLFSVTGYFWKREVGGFYATVTNLKQSVLIDARRKVVISPENADEFIADLKNVIGKADH